MNYQYAICSNCSTQAGYSEHISHKPTVIARFFFCLFIFIKLSQYMPSWVLVVMLQCIASWEREVDRSDAKAAGSFLCISIHLGIFWHRADFVCVYIQHTTYYILAKSVHIASIVCSLENSLCLSCLLQAQFRDKETKNKQTNKQTKNIWLFHQMKP